MMLIHAKRSKSTRCAPPMGNLVHLLIFMWMQTRCTFATLLEIHALGFLAVKSS